MSLIDFRVPYYVGRLNTYYKQFTDKSHNVWIEKYEQYKNTRVQIRPWNFDKIVDKDASAQRFIERMVSKCSYIYLED